MKDANAIIGKNFKCGKNLRIGYNCIIEDNVELGNDVFIDHNCIIRQNTKIGNQCNIGANCIIGEHLADFYKEHKVQNSGITIGNNALIRSNTILYGDSIIGDNFQTGHHVTIREKAVIGSNVSVGTLSDIQGDCEIGNYVRMHSSVHIGQKSKIDDFVWIFPYVVLTNDPTPPSENLFGIHLKSFSVIATGSTLLPGITVEQDTLVGAGSVVTRNVERNRVVVGNPAKVIADINDIKDPITKNPAYPWRLHFKRGMPWQETDYVTWYKNIEGQVQSTGKDK